MYGYVRAYKPEMKFREYDEYRAYYCGLCGTLQEQYGRLSQWTLSYDMTFLIMLLDSLYEPEVQERKCRCAVHPFKKQLHLYNEITEYAADMSVLLFHEKCLDDWIDEKKISRRFASALLHRSKKRVEKKYVEKSAKIATSLQELHTMEAQNEPNPELPAGCFGRLLGEVFAWKSDIWENTLRQMGFYLGKYIYFLDAYDDLEKDKKAKCYNPLIPLSESDANFDDTCEQWLQMMIAACAEQFEQLPLIKNEEILRNILYAGVWTGFRQAKQEKHEKQEKAEQKRRNDHGSI